ncbi:MAG: hypothetical protein J4469_00930 [Candidatus Aenigmarchaeota archaeon]|nr:hypothetical protein [Candidatus Aenigmarchaeota archaeon]
MKKQRFRDVYDKIPEAERKFTIIVIDGKEINWDLAKYEVENNTQLGEKILEKMAELEII